MGQSGDASAEQPRMSAAPEGNEKPARLQNGAPASANADGIPDEAVREDVTTQIVSHAPATPPPDALPMPPRRSGAPQPADASVGSGSHRPTPSIADSRQSNPHVVPVVSNQANQRPANPAAMPAPFYTAQSWGATTFVITAETAAGFSYLFWWISGLLVYFNERENRYVRFHAVQSILLTGLLSVYSVIAFTIAALCNDAFVSTHQHAWQTLAQGTVALSVLIVVLPWLLAMVAAWTGTYLRLPIIGDYAERFAAPPVQIQP